MISVESAGQTDVGQKRKGNEDSFLIDDQLQLYVVADGMGGRKAGEVASRLVVDTISKTMHKLVSAEIRTRWWASTATCPHRPTNLYTPFAGPI
jgi:serine/threonine protein phosphatase PrpC